MASLTRALVALAAGVLVMIDGTAPRADGLESVRWEYRPLLIFTPAPENAQLSRQTTILADAPDGLEDRRIAVYIVEQNRVYTTFGAPSPGADAETLRRRFRIPDDTFRVVLVGLDGVAKLTQDAPLSIDKLFSTIDAMPMRRREMRERGDLP